MIHFRRLIKLNTCHRMLVIFGAVFTLAMGGEAVAGSCDAYNSGGKLVNPQIFFGSGNEIIKAPRDVAIGTVIWRSPPVRVGVLRFDCVFGENPISIWSSWGGRIQKGDSLIPIPDTGLSFRLKGSNGVSQFITSDSVVVNGGVSGYTPDFKTLTLSW